MKKANNTFFILIPPFINLRYNKYITIWRKCSMEIEMYYNDLTIRLLGLLILSLIPSYFYLKKLVSLEKSFLKTNKFIYLLQIIFWTLFLANVFDTVPKKLPWLPNVIGFFIFEMTILIVIFISLIYLLWRLYNEKKFDVLIFFCTLILMLLFILALGMT